MKLSIIIVNYLVDKEVVKCVKSINKFNDVKSYEVIIVDNSPENTLEDKLINFKNVKYIKNNKNVGYGTACNIGVKQAKGEYIFILNPDTEIIQGSIKKLIGKFKDKKIAGVAPLLMKTNNRPYPNQGVRVLTPIKALLSLSFIGRIFPNNPIRKSYYHNVISTSDDMETDILPGTAFIIRSDIYRKMKGFDEEFFLYFEEFDLFKRIKEKGFKMMISPDLKIMHLWGKSTKKLTNIQKIFNKSRFYYFRKHNPLPVALFTELFIRLNLIYFFVFLILLLALTLRLFRLAESMIFLGDQGWFYLSAYEMIKHGTIPLLGIKSSVVWLHQGPLATYMIAIALYIGRLNPLAPAILFSFLDVLTTFIIFLAANKLFNRWAGLAASFFYATSPLVLISARTPYHTTPIPFLLSLLLLLIAFFNKRNAKVFIALIFLITGLLIQLELSNAVILLVLPVLFVIKYLPFRKSFIIPSAVGFATGILPFILHDLTHYFVQTIGFPLWIINRIRLFLGLTFSDNATILKTPSALNMIFGQVAAIFSANSTFILIVFVILFVLALFFNRKFINKKIILVFSFFFIPLFSFLVHAAPGAAYFPLLFPSVAILVGYTAYHISKKYKIGIALIFVLGLLNSYIMAENNFFVITTKEKVLPVNHYSYGYSYLLVDEAADAIVKNANGRIVTLEGKGVMGLFPSALDNLKYLILVKGGKIGGSNNEQVKYLISDYQYNLSNVIFKNNIYKISKNENN